MLLNNAFWHCPVFRMMDMIRLTEHFSLNILLKPGFHTLTTYSKVKCRKLHPNYMVLLIVWLLHKWPRWANKWMQVFWTFLSFLIFHFSLHLCIFFCFILECLQVSVINLTIYSLIWRHAWILTHPIYTPPSHFNAAMFFVPLVTILSRFRWIS